MKRLPPSLLVLVTAVGAVRADDIGGLFAELDGDHDGQIAKAEISPEHSVLFARLVRRADEDSNGLLSEQEFRDGLARTRPEKLLTEKAESELPGSDALLLMLAWMDRDANLIITANEVPDRLSQLFEQFAELGNEKNKTRLRVPQLRQQSYRYASVSARYANQQGIDVEVELALLSDAEWDYVQRLKTSLRPGNKVANPGMYQERAAMFFAELDTDGNGKVEADEVPEPLAERFSRLLDRGDRDQDKQLSEQEFKSMSLQMAIIDSNRPPLTETTQRVRQLLRRSDGNGDGQLSRAEAAPRIARRFSRLDENGDGHLDRDELTRAVENLVTLRNSTVNPRSSGRLRGEGAENAGKN